MGGHPTVTVVPALLALGEQMKASGRLFIESFVAGYETSGRVGRLVAPSHYLKGFHVTGTVGSFSATAAAGRMLGLSDSQLAVAFGIAATQAAGLKSNFGTMCKPLHAGTASEHGLRAARLAAKGFTARGDSLECDQGFASSQSDDLNVESALGEPRSAIRASPPRRATTSTSSRRWASRRPAGTCATISSSTMRPATSPMRPSNAPRRSGCGTISRRSG
ncbi:MAG: MmgE/PrpD family protein, partial [Alphaproteobacteria bacterium]|nr:MmgE/PrpD family protein [Alphaproteobacteria bacterium]